MDQQETTSAVPWLNVPKWSLVGIFNTTRDTRKRGNRGIWKNTACEIHHHNNTFYKSVQECETTVATGEVKMKKDNNYVRPRWVYVF